MSFTIEDARSNSMEQNVFKRLHLLSRPVVECTDSYLDTASKQELDTVTQYDPRIIMPVHATTAGLSQFSFLKRPQTEMSSVGFSLPPLRGLGQSDQNSPPDEPLVRSTWVNESKVRGGLEGNWELAGELLNAQLSQVLKISPHPGFLKNRSLVRPSSPSSTGDRSASFFQGNVSCSSEQLETKQANSVSLCITSHPKHTPDTGHALLDVNSEWQSKKVQADDSSDLSDPFCCDTTAQPPLSTSGINDTDQRSLAHECDLDLEEPSYFFWQDASYDEQYNEESRFETDPKSPCPNDAAFVCPAALSKLMSGQAKTLVRERVE